MKNSLNHFLMIMTCLSTFLIACDDEGSSGGDTAGETTAGEAAAGEAAAGEAAAGEAAAGEAAAGEAAAGEAAAGEAAAGEAAAGEAAAGEAAAGEAAAGETVAGETTAGETMGGDTCEEACEAILGCNLEGGPEDAETCVIGCREAQGDPSFERSLSCTLEHLAGGMCDEAGFISCLTPTVGYFNELAGLYCAKIFSCCPDGDTPFESQEECQGFIGGFAGALSSEGVNQGLTVFSEESAAECLTALQTYFAETSCETIDFENLFPNELAVCDNVFVGQVGEGGVCGYEEEDGVASLSDACTGDLVCGFVNGDDLPICTPPIALGEVCDYEVECVEGAECIDGVCGVQSAAGEACESDEACTSGICDEGVCGDEGLICGG